jgi:hypothetical protein
MINGDWKKYQLALEKNRLKSSSPTMFKSTVVIDPRSRKKFTRL